MRVEQQLPLVLALTICDDVWFDRNTRKSSVMGIFATVAARTMPHVVGRLAVYLCLTECPAKMNVQVRIVDVNESRPAVAQTQELIESSDPRQTLQGVYRFDAVSFPEFGEYRVQLLADGELMLERRLVLLQIG